MEPHSASRRYGGNQSPELWLGAMVRHLKRLTVGIHEAPKTDHKLWHPTAPSTELDRYLAV